MDWPTRIALFPLPNVLLFPGLPLPLHVFEPRYQELVNDVDKGDHLVGIVLLKGEWRQEYYGNPGVYEIGCAGRLINVEELEDGRSNILLQGVREFRILSHIMEKPYREAEVEWRPVASESLEHGERGELATLLERFLDDEISEAAARILREPSVSDAAFVNSLCYILDLAPLEKQALLQEVCIADRARRLREIVEFHLEEQRFFSGPPSLERYH